MTLRTQTDTGTPQNPINHPHRNLATRNNHHHLHPPCCDISPSSLPRCITSLSPWQHLEEDRHTHTATLLTFTFGAGQGEERVKQDRHEQVILFSHNNTTKTATGGHAPDDDFCLFNGIIVIIFFLK